MGRPTRIALAYITLALLAIAAWKLIPTSGSEPQFTGSDIVLVTLDTTRADALGCYGAKGGVSPTLDTIAEMGVVFEHCSTSSSITPVAHASILTGMQPYQHGLRFFTGRSGYRLPSYVPTLATVLQERGYTTMAVHSAFPVSGAFGFDAGFDIFESFEADFVHELGGRRDVKEFQRRSDVTVRLALERLEAIEGPLFLWVHFFDTHDAKIRPPEAFRSEALKAMVKDGDLHREALYAEEIRFQDSQLGVLLNALRDAGRLQNAYVAVVADHGEGLAGGLERHGWYRHAILYEDQLRVPLVLSGPNLPAGLRVTSQVRTIDLMPTMLELVTCPIPESVAGTSLLPLLSNDDSSRYAYAEQLSGYELIPPANLKARPLDSFVYSMSDGRWKLMYRPATPQSSELFDLSTDPGEVNNLFGQHPEPLARLLRELAAQDPWLDRPSQLEPHDTTPEFTAAITSLGYAISDPVERTTPTWAWSCLTDGTQTSTRGPCPNCGAARLLTAAGESPLPN